MHTHTHSLSLSLIHIYTTHTHTHTHLQATKNNIWEHFVHFGDIRKITIPEPFKGVATITYVRRESVEEALASKTHRICGVNVVVKRQQHMSKKAGDGHLNTLTPWKTVQQANKIDPDEVCSVFVCVCAYVCICVHEHVCIMDI